MAAEDPAIEIARLLRPVDAKSQSKLSGLDPDGAAAPAARPPEPPVKTPEPPARTPEVGRPAQPELLLGSDETPKLGERVRRQPAPPAKAAPRDGGNVRQRLMRSAVARRATGAIAQDRAAPRAPRPDSSGSEGSAVPPAGPADRHPEPPSSPALAEPETEPLPRCLTEPWDDLDADLAKLRGGQDKGARRWPFRRGRSGDQAAHQGDGEDTD